MSRQVGSRRRRRNKRSGPTTAAEGRPEQPTAETQNRHADSPGPRVPVWRGRLLHAVGKRFADNVGPALCLPFARNSWRQKTPASFQRRNSVSARAPLFRGPQSRFSLPTYFRGIAPAALVHRARGEGQSLQDFRRPSRREGLVAGHRRSSRCLGEFAPYSK